MTESVIMVFLLGALLIFEFQQQKAIKIKAKSSVMKYLIAFVTAILIVVLFWTNSMQSNIKLILIALLFASVALYNQGLGKGKVITYGSLSKASNYGRYDHIIIEKANQDTMVTFASKKGGSYSLRFTEDEKVIRKFLKKNVSKPVKILTGEEFEQKLELENKRQSTLQEHQLEMIRNRPNKNKLVRPLMKNTK